MFKKLVSSVLLVLVIASFKTASAGPILVGRGAGYSEYSLIFARANLELLFQDCVSISCGIVDDERPLANELVRRAHVAPQLVFKNDSEMGNQEIFRRIADGVVWINQDQLWTDTAKTIPYGTGDAMALWCQILGVDLDVVLLERVEDKVRETFQRQVLRSELSTQPKRSFEFLLWKRPEAMDQLVIRDVTLQTVALSEAIAAQVDCAGASVKAMEIFSPVWIEDLRDDQHVTLNLNFGVRWTCNGEGDHGGNSLGHVIIDANADANAVFTFDTASLFVSVEAGGSHH